MTVNKNNTKDLPLVTILTPCYNGEKFIDRYVKSVLIQNYSNIELIFVNDGSTDNSESILLSFKEKFDKNGIKLIYIQQENKGLGGAINTGLTKVTGKYLCWPDIDDYFEPESIRLRVEFLEKNTDYAIVTSDAYIRRIDNLDKILGLVSKGITTNNDSKQFHHLLNGKSIFCPGTHMVRTDAFFETHPTGQIYPARHGQTWQMLLPLYYKYKRYFLEIPLYNYIQHNDSICAKQYTDVLNVHLNRLNEMESTIIETLKQMTMKDYHREVIIEKIKQKYAVSAFNYAYQYGDFKVLVGKYKIFNLTTKFNYKILLKFLKAFQSSTNNKSR